MCKRIASLGASRMLTQWSLLEVMRYPSRPGPAGEVEVRVTFQCCSYTMVGGRRWCSYTECPSVLRSARVVSVAPAFRWKSVQDQLKQTKCTASFTALIYCTIEARENLRRAIGQRQRPDEPKEQTKVKQELLRLGRVDVSRGSSGGDGSFKCVLIVTGHKATVLDDIQTEQKYDVVVLGC